MTIGQRQFLTLCLVLGTFGVAWAQQPAQYSLFMLNKYAYNNAYNGLDQSLSITGVFRKQWLNFPGSPLTLNFNAHLPLEMINSGAGISVEYDVLGAYSNITLRGSYSYILDFKEAGRLSIGVAGRFLQKELDGTRLLTPDGIYENGINHNDPNVPNARSLGTSLTFDAALYYQHESFEIGIAATHLNQPTLDLATDASVLFNRAYFLMGSTTIPINSSFTLEPSLLVQTDFVKFQPELAVLLHWKDNVFGGVGFRGYSQTTTDALIFTAGLKFMDHFTVAYAYDWSIGSLQVYNTGSHEIVLNYNLNKKIGKELPSKIIYNPRFL